MKNYDPCSDLVFLADLEDESCHYSGANELEKKKGCSIDHLLLSSCDQNQLCGPSLHRSHGSNKVR